MSKKWGNALGGYRKQNRKGGKFSSGFAGQSIKGSAKIAGSTPAQRRAQYLEGKRKAAVVEKRKKTAKSVLKGAAIVGVVGAGAYVATKHLQAANQTPRVPLALTAGTGPIGPSAGARRASARFTMNEARKGFATNSKHVMQGAAVVTSVSGAAASVRRDLRNDRQEREKSQRAFSGVVTSVNSQGRKPYASGGVSPLAAAQRQSVVSGQKHGVHSTGKSGRGGPVHTFTNGEEKTSSFAGGDFQNEDAYAKLHIGFVPPRGNGESDDRKVKQILKGRPSGSPVSRTHAVAPIGQGPQGNKRSVNLSASGKSRPGTSNMNDVTAPNRRTQWHVKSGEGGVVKFVPPTYNVDTNVSLNPSPRAARNKASRMSDKEKAAVLVNSPYANEKMHRDLSAVVDWPTMSQMEVAPQVKHKSDPAPLTPGQRKRANDLYGGTGPVPSNVSNYYSPHIDPVIDRKDRSSNALAGNYGSADDAVSVVPFGNGQEDLNTFMANNQAHKFEPRKKSTGSYGKDKRQAGAKKAGRRKMSNGQVYKVTKLPMDNDSVAHVTSGRRIQ